MWRRASSGLESRLGWRASRFVGLLLLVLVVVGFLQRRDASPRVDGKSLQQWVELAAGPSGNHETIQRLSTLGPKAYPWLVSYLNAPDEVPSPFGFTSVRSHLPKWIQRWFPDRRPTALERCRVALRVVGAIGACSESPGVVASVVPLLEREAMAPDAAEALLRLRPISHSALERVARTLIDEPRRSMTTNHVRILWAHGTSDAHQFVGLSQSLDPAVSLVGRAGVDWFAGRKGPALEQLDTPWRGRGEGEVGRREVGRWTRRMSLTVLAELGAQARPLADVWIQRLQTPGDPDAREAAAMCLGSLGRTDLPSTALAALVVCLEPGEEPQVRLAAIEALGRAGKRGTGIGGPLEALLQGSDEEVIGAARRALEQMDLDR